MQNGLAIAGKIVEITSDATHSALVDAMGVRRKVDLGMLREDKPKTVIGC
jgi:hydrogenase maturation factor